MLFLLSLVGDGGAGFPICEQRKQKQEPCLSSSEEYLVPLCPRCSGQESTADGLSERNQAIALALLHAGLSIEACITLA